ncbi:hypothetical protein [Bradyrhizobium septentrionale]|uniref:Uncharacterized protein n=1 Tax=Bradyrhizobium septentrionale TaxID=1404411 RepID=A0ABZ2P7M7_9BRAD
MGTAQRAYTKMTAHRTYQAILTKYLSATNTKGSRIKASAAAGNITLHLDHALSSEANHAKAAEALAEQFGWAGSWQMGSMPSDSGFCFVCGCAGDEPAFITGGAA